MNLSYLQKVRRDLGMCVDCGGPLETLKDGKGSALIRCAACREKRQQLVQYAKHKQNRQAEKREAEKREAEKKRTRGAAPKSLILPSAVCGKAADLESLRDSNLIDYAPPRAVCKTCVWATYTGGGVYFCPLSVCVRVKLSDILNTQDPNATNALDTTEAIAQ